MADVAQRAGVSTMTVSNVLNGRKVQPDTRAAVLAAVKELNYTPNPAARALASASMIRIGLVYRSIETAFLSAVLVGALDATARLGAQLLIRRYDDDAAESGVAAVNALVDAGASALLLPAPFAEAASRLDLGTAAGVPLMALSPGGELPNMAAVRIDDFGAARDMTALLIGLGHRRIGFIRGPETHMIGVTRHDGYRAALARHGIAADPALIVAGALNFESGLAAAERLLALADPPTAIFASNDDMAVAVLSLAHRRGLAIPEQLSVAGFDDSPIATKIWPTLTTVRQPIAAIADLATERLMQRLRAHPGEEVAQPATSYLRYDLVTRASTGPAPAR